MKSSQLSYPNRPAVWRISPECCRLINDRHRQPEAFVLFLRLRCEASRHKESRELRESSVRSKKCPDSPQTVENTKIQQILSKWWKEIGLGRQSVKLWSVLFSVSSFLHFLSENSSPHDFKPVFTVTIWLLFWKEQIRAFPFFIHSFSCKAQCDKTERRLPS